ncbi:MAG: aminoacyl-tRNA hydrolase [Nitriliruptorales bacterium]|nr:aminoacyl-tRNA hydrolase [Nitriliruptorales bacterium]
MPAIRVNHEVSVDETELEFSFARSGGPGGQHANTSSTKVELRWNVDASPALDTAQRDLIRHRLGNRINAEGFLVLQSSEYRSQTRNREAMTGRFATLVGDALRVQASRRPTKPTRAARRRRLEAKRQRSQTKALRKDPLPD